jgi:hypothetical protein
MGEAVREYRTVQVEIRRNSDGEVRLYSDEYWSGNPYVWADGNYSCDCNRELFFEQVAGNDAWETLECTDGRFSVRVTDNEKVVHQDGVWPNG